MKKKIPYAILSIVLIFSLVCPAFAVPLQGIYIGGDILKYYSFSDFMSSATKTQEMNTATLPNVKLYQDNKIASASEILAAGGLTGAMKNYVLGNLPGTYTDVNGNRITPEDPVIPPVTDLHVDEVTVINYTTLLVSLNKEATAISATDFTIDKGLTVLKAEFFNNQKTVKVTTIPQTYNTLYTISFKGVNSGVTFVGAKLPTQSSAIKFSEYNSVHKLASTVHDEVNVLRGARKFTVTTTLTGKVNIVLASTDNVTLNEFGDYEFKDAGNLTADFGTNTQPAFITRVNDAPVIPFTEELNFVKEVKNVQIPANGTITFEVNCNNADSDVIPVVYQDVTTDGLNINSAGLATESFAVGGLTAWTNAQAVSDTYSNVFVGNVVLPDNNVFDRTEGNQYFAYDANDTFRIYGNTVTMAQFESVLSSTDTLSIVYDPDGVSIFDITWDREFEAEAINPAAAVTNLDNEAFANDVELTFVTPPTSNTNTVYTIQRASTTGKDGVPISGDEPENDYFWTNIGSVTDETANTTVVYEDMDVADGSYVYRIRVIHPILTDRILNSGVTTPVQIPGTKDTDRPVLVKFDLEQGPISGWNGGSIYDVSNPGELGVGDKIFLLFDQPIVIANDAVIRLQEFNADNNDVTEGDYANIKYNVGSRWTTATRGDLTLLTIEITQAPIVNRAPISNDNILQMNSTNMPLKIKIAGGIADKAGNEWVPDERIFVDKNAPDVIAYSTNADFAAIDSYSIRITFNEPVNIGSAQDLSTYAKNYMVYTYDNNNNKQVNPVVNAKVDEDNWNVVTLTTGNPITPGSLLTQRVADLCLNVAEQTDIRSTNSAPVLVANGPEVPVRNANAIFNGTVSDPNGDFVTLTADGHPVAVSSGTWTYHPTFSSDGSHSVVFVATDVFGATSSVTKEITVDVTGPVVSSVDGIDNNENNRAIFFFNEPLNASTVDDFGNLNWDDFSFTLANSNALHDVQYNAANNSITLEFDKALETGDTITLKAGAVTDTVGNPNVANTHTVPDRVKPSITHVSYHDGIVTIDFSEPVRTPELNPDLKCAQFKIKSSPTATTAVNVLAVELSRNNQIQLTIEEPDSGNYSLAIDDGAVEDLAGNHLLDGNGSFTVSSGH